MRCGARNRGRGRGGGACRRYDAVKDSFKLTAADMKGARKDMIVMHPLPRVGEITTDVDADPRAAWFREVGYGMITRMALLSMVLGKA